MVKISRVIFLSMGEFLFSHRLQRCMHYMYMDKFVHNYVHNCANLCIIVQKCISAIQICTYIRTKLYINYVCTIMYIIMYSFVHFCYERLVHGLMDKTVHGLDSVHSP